MFLCYADAVKLTWLVLLQADALTTCMAATEVLPDEWFSLRMGVYCAIMFTAVCFEMSKTFYTPNRLWIMLTVPMIALGVYEVLDVAGVLAPKAVVASGVFASLTQCQPMLRVSDAFHVVVLAASPLAACALYRLPPPAPRFPPFQVAAPPFSRDFIDSEADSPDEDAHLRHPGGSV